MVGIKCVSVIIAYTLLIIQDNIVPTKACVSCIIQEPLQMFNLSIVKLKKKQIRITTPRPFIKIYVDTFEGQYGSKTTTADCRTPTATDPTVSNATVTTAAPTTPAATPPTTAATPPTTAGTDPTGPTATAEAQWTGPTRAPAPVVDVSLFWRPDGLSGLTADERRTAVVLLIADGVGSPAADRRPPDVICVVRNLLAALADTPGLVRDGLDDRQLARALTVLTADPCALRHAAPGPLVRLLVRLMALPAPRLRNAVPGPALYAVAAAAPADAAFDGPSSADHVAQFVTSLALSGDRFGRLPTPFLGSLLRHLAARPVLLLRKVPPSTLAGFLDGMLAAALDPADHPPGALPVGAVLGPVMTARTLSVLPAATVDLMLAVLSAPPPVGPPLSAVTGLVSLCVTLHDSPAFLARSGPVRLARFLDALVDYAGTGAIPSAPVERLLQAVFVYAPDTYDQMTKT